MWSQLTLEPGLPTGGGDLGLEPPVRIMQILYLFNRLPLLKTKNLSINIIPYSILTCSAESEIERQHSTHMSKEANDSNKQSFTLLEIIIRDCSYSWVLVRILEIF